MSTEKSEKMETESVAGGTTNSDAEASTSQKVSFEINGQPVCLIVLGMAGSGKTQFVKKLTQFAQIKELGMYAVNLDPACKEVPYHASIGRSIVMNLCAFHLILMLKSFANRYPGYSKL